MGAVRAKHYDVFVSYKRDDDAAREVLCTALEEAGFEPWWDAKLGQGDFRDQLRDQINRCDVVIALWSISAHARPDEVKMEMAHAFGVKKLLPVRLDDAPIPHQFSKENFLPFDGWADSDRSRTQLARILAEARELGAQPSQKPRGESVHTIQADIGELPPAPSRLIGRDLEMQMLRDAWNDRTINAVVLHALGGAGKSALLRAFVNERLAAGGDGATRIYGWSAYSQGSGEQKRADADGFLAKALLDFGYQGPPLLDNVESGRTLARLVQRERVLMLLDGLEPLQESPGAMGGRFKDKGLAAFVKALGTQNPGLLVLTSRQDVPELEGFGDLVVRHPLEELSNTAGADLLIDLGVRGSEVELEAAVSELGGHALSVTLLGTFLAEVLGGDIKQRRQFTFGDILLTVAERENADRTVRYAKKVEKILQAYLERFDQLAQNSNHVGATERVLLRLLGLFDRPADGSAVEMLLGEEIPGLTDELFTTVVETRNIFGIRRKTSRTLTSEERSTRLREAKARLRKLRLLVSSDANDPSSLDAHPVVRAFFTAWLQNNVPAATKLAHSKLFHHYSVFAEYQPNTLEEMQPLFLALQHGVKAGHVVEAFESIYVERIYRKYFICHGLGAYGAMLAALSNFFDKLWSTPKSILSQNARNFILADASYALRALGRLQESIPPREAALTAYVSEARWDDASNVGEVLSSTYLILGDVTRATAVAQEVVNYASKGENRFRHRCSAIVLGNALACRGDLDSAVIQYEIAEEASGEWLESFGGYHFGEILISRGAAREALERGYHQLSEAQSDANRIVLHNIGLAWLLIGKAQEALGSSDAAISLDAAVQGLHRAGMAQHLPLALLARAAQRRRRIAGGEAVLLDGLQVDLNEIADIAGSEMRLFLTDLALERASFALEVPWAFDAPREEAVRQVAIAAQLISETGYHRRDGKLADLTARLTAKDA